MYSHEQSAPRLLLAWRTCYCGRTGREDAWRLPITPCTFWMRGTAAAALPGAAPVFWLQAACVTVLCTVPVSIVIPTSPVSPRPWSSPTCKTDTLSLAQLSAALDDLLPANAAHLRVARDRLIPPRVTPVAAMQSCQRGLL